MRTATIVSGCLAFSLICGPVPTQAQGTPCTDPIVGIGAVSPLHGFPEYYADSSGLALDLCLDRALCLDPLDPLALPNPALPISFPDNFPTAVFWWYAESTMVMPGGGDAKLVMAVEGNFNNGIPVPGDQFSFGMIKISLSTLVPFSTYTVTHPYGVDLLTTDPGGQADLVDRIGAFAGPGNPASFAGVSNSRVGPFLIFDDPDPNKAPSPGFVGNIFIPHRVSGSPCGQNFFRIEGPGLPPGGVETDQFLVLGRMIDVCGNGVLDPGEECDDGNQVDGDCCSSACAIEVAAVLCDDGNPCTDELCVPGTGCQNPPNNLPCDDADACTTMDTCSGGVCIGGPAPDCDDGNPCTVDTCDSVLGCQNVNVSLPCDDGNACTTNDTCSNGVCVGGSPLDCNDGNVCTDDSCDTVSGCVSVNNAAACEDGDSCTTGDTCVAGTCVSGPAPNCDDNNLCTDDSCVPATGCVHLANGAPRDDANACTTGDTCVAGVCSGGAPPNCDDANVCTDDSCDPASGCGHVANGLPCDDGSACTVGDLCSGGACQGGAAPDCDDGNPCTDDSCDPGVGCLNFANTSPCDDGNACTTVDVCAAGQCVGSTPPNCDDGNVCTDDSCDTQLGCVNANNALPCDDGNACTTADSCSGGICVAGPPPNCDDGNVCTDDGCDPGSGCVHQSNGVACDDGDACTTNDTCVAGVCVGGIAPNCDDGNVCTDDSCDTQLGCISTNNALPCDDGNACTTSDACVAGACIGGAAPNCDDGNVCTDDSCDPGTGCLNLANTAGCDDGNACSTNDSCSAGLCVGGPPLDCNDGNGCTADSCDAIVGCLNENVAVACDDGDACTTNDGCSGGSCVGGAPPNCDDGNVCTDDSCDVQLGCVNVNNLASCDDGSACTTNDACAAGLCIGGPPPNCDDGNVCTDDSCVAATGCLNTANVAVCDDGSACTTSDTCSAGACVGGPPPDCNDGNLCTDDSCAPATGCLNTANSVSCDDGDACTTGDTCSGAACVGGAPANCDDGNVCTNDSCDPGIGCVNQPNASACDDGNLCTTNDTCVGGVCVGGAPLDCSDGNVCTSDSCDAQLGCLHANNIDPCDDGSACTLNDQCSGGLCVGGPAPDCDDGNVCTDDSCDAGTGCVHQANTFSCDDGDACTTADTCSAGQCVGGPTPDCNDGNECTADSCDPLAGCQHANVSISCDDGDACTTNDTCSGGQCLGGLPPQCDDGNICTDDSCDLVAGCVNTDNSAPCDDGDACTVSDTCGGGLCVGGPPLDCDDGNVCTDDSCDSASGCIASSNTAVCDDGLAWTLGDECSAGQCQPGAFGCPATPVSACVQPVTGGRATLALKDSSPDTRDKLAWAWKRGAATAKQDFGDPVSGGEYRLCFYDEVGGQASLVMEQVLPGGGQCGARSCWKETTKGFVYKDRFASNAPGVKSAVFKAGVDGKASIKVKGQGEGLDMPTLPLSLDTQASMQIMRDTGACWQADYGRPPKKNTSKFFKGKAVAGP
ncbi:MAG: hypothetical protein ACE5E4_06030 [Candidatus Binatia bacterium]